MHCSNAKTEITGERTNNSGGTNIAPSIRKLSKSEIVAILRSLHAKGKFPTEMLLRPCFLCSEDAMDEKNQIYWRGSMLVARS